MSAIRYLVEQAVNLLNSQKFSISRFHAAAATEICPKNIYQLNDHQNIVRKLTKFT
jgi:ferredoxin-like protein FixX